MRRHGLLLLTLLAASCGLLTSGTVADGDSEFRLGEYLRALAHYEDAWDSGNHSDELSAKIAETRYRVLAGYARKLIQENDPQRALEVLDRADALRTGHPLTTQLRHRAAQELARDFAAIGLDLLQDDRPEEALETYTRALAWDPSYEPAQEGYEEARARSDNNARRAEAFFLSGLRDLGEGKQIQALTAFSAAEDLWGEDSRATKFLDEIRHTLSERSRREAQEYLQAGMTGPAWLALRDAARLTPGVPELEESLAAVESRLEADIALRKADGAIRAGELEFAEEQIVLAGQVGGAARAAEINELEASLKTRRNRDRYILARALELDQQLARSAALYQKILDEGGARDADVRIRLQRLQLRLGRAQIAYREAIAAQAAGNTALYKERLEETIRLARDYEDALDRIKGLD